MQCTAAVVVVADNTAADHTIARVAGNTVAAAVAVVADTPSRLFVALVIAANFTSLVRRSVRYTAELDFVGIPFLSFDQRVKTLCSS